MAAACAPGAEQAFPAGAAARGLIRALALLSTIAAVIAAQACGLSALRMPYGAMSETNLATIDRLIGIVRDHGRLRGSGAGARGAESRRKPLKSRDSGAKSPPVRSSIAKRERGETASEEALTADREDLADLTAQEEADGTEWRRNLLKSLVSGAGMARVAFSIHLTNALGVMPLRSQAPQNDPTSVPSTITTASAISAPTIATMKTSL